MLRPDEMRTIEHRLSLARSVLVGVGLSLGSAGCNDTPYSCKIDNETLLLRATVSELDAVAEQPRVRVEIELEAAGGELGTGTTLALCPDEDRLEVNGVQTEELSALGHLYYIAEFTTRESSYQITLARPSHEDVEITIELPPSFEIELPDASVDHSRGAAIDIGWSPAWPNNQLALSVADEIGSACIDGLGIELDVDDTGSYSVPAGTLVGTGTCQVTVSLTRLAEADYPASLAPGGNATAIVTRRLAINTN
jgi:hypothetical protein